MGVEIRRIVAAWLQRNHWRREAKAARARIAVLERQCAEMCADHLHERMGLLDRALQAAALSALPRRVPVKSAHIEAVKPEPELDDTQAAIRDAYLMQAREAGLSASEGQKMFDAFRRGEDYTYSE